MRRLENSHFRLKGEGAAEAGLAAWGAPLPRVVERRVNPRPRARPREGPAEREEE